MRLAHDRYTYGMLMSVLSPVPTAMAGMVPLIEPLLFRQSLVLASPLPHHLHYNTWSEDC